MSFRQPFRSGLRDLAQGLMQQSQMMQQQSQQELQMRQQMAAQQAQSQAEMGQMLGQGISQAAGMIGQGLTNAYNAQRQAEAAQAQDVINAARIRGENILKIVQPEIDTMRQQLVVLQATNGAPEVIQGLSRHIASLEGLLTVDDVAKIPEIYQRITQSTFRGAQDAPTIRELAAGRVAQDLEPEFDLTELRNRALFEANIADRVLNVQVNSVEDFQRLLREFDPSNPTSVLNAEAAISRSASLPGPLQLAADPLKERLARFYNNPTEMQLYDNAISVDTAKAQEARTRANAAQVALDHAQRINPIMYQQALGALTDDQRGRVADAFVTGNLQGLSNEELIGLARWAGVSPDNLRAWSTERANAYMTATTARERLDVLNADLADQRLEIGNQTIELNELQLERGQWDFERVKILATRDDAIAQENLIQNIGAAIANNDPDLLRMYWDAYRNPTSLLGTQLRMVLGPNYDNEFERLFNETRTRFNLELQILNNDVVLKDQAVQMGRLKLQQQIELNPFETAALRARYDLDTARAVQDFRNLPFDTAANIFKSAAGMADVVPPSFWDSVPSDLASIMRANGVRIDDMRLLSENAAFLAADPNRRFDWQAFDFIVQNGPPQSPEELQLALQQAEGLLLNMGYDPLVAAAMVNTMQASWAADEAKVAEGLYFIEGLVEPMSAIEIQRAASVWNSLVSSLNLELGSLANRVSLTGCATIVNPGSLSPMLIPSKTERTADGSELCSVVVGQFTDLEKRLQNATQAQEWWAQTLQRVTTGASFGGNAPMAPVAPSNLGGTSAPSTSGGRAAITPAPNTASTELPVPIPAPSSQVAPSTALSIDWEAVSQQIDWQQNGINVTSEDQAAFQRLANAVVFEDGETFDSIVGNLVRNYGEDAVRRFLADLLQYSGVTIPRAGDN